MKINGALSAVIGFLLWGILPIYWKQISYVPSLEIFAHRIIWSLLFVTLLLTVNKNWGWLKVAIKNPRKILIFTISSLFIGINWYIYIYAVNNNFIVEASLGYFINPLFNVFLGVIFFREKLSKNQWLAVGLAFIAVSYLTISYGRLPWVALTLAFCFGIYGLLRKIAKLGASEGLFIEMLILSIPALVYLISISISGSGSFTNIDFKTDIYLVLAGLVTMLPLLFFTHAAQKVPLSTLGLLQYMAPLLQFLIGVFLYAEEFGTKDLIGFTGIWLALSIYTFDLLRRSRKKSTN